MKWVSTKLSEVASFQAGNAWKSSNFNDKGLGLPVIRIQNVTDSNVSNFVFWDLDFDKRYLIHKDDLLLSLSGSFRACFWNGPEALLNQRIVRLVERSEIIERKWLYYFLNYHIQQIAGLGRHALISNVSLTDLKKLKIQIPPISEQRRIVEILDQADALRKKHAEADAIPARILPALFYKMFGDPATNPMGWDIMTLADGGATVRYGLGQPPDSDPSGVPLIRATNIRRGVINDEDVLLVRRESVPEKRNAFLSADEVIVVRSGAYTGDVAQVTERWAGSVAGYDLVVTPGESFCGEYIESYLLTPHIQNNYFANLKSRSGQPHLNAAQLSDTPVPQPPKEIQLGFSAHVKAIRQLRVRLSDSGQRLDVLFSTILHRAFNGDLTAKWREAHMEELLAEMEAQVKALKLEMAH